MVQKNSTICLGKVMATVSQLWKTLDLPSADLMLHTERHIELPCGNTVFLGRDADGRSHLLVPLDCYQAGVSLKSKAVVLACQELILSLIHI